MQARLETRVAESETQYPTPGSDLSKISDSGLRPFQNFRLLNIKGMKVHC